MIRYRRDLDVYQFYSTPNQISYWKEIDEDKLQSAIDLFNEEIKWDRMWNVEDAKKRLKEGRLMVVLEIDDKLRGWYWLNYETKEGLNLYVHKDSRNRGYGFGLISYIFLEIRNKYKLSTHQFCLMHLYLNTRLRGKMIIYINR